MQKAIGMLLVAAGVFGFAAGAAMTMGDGDYPLYLHVGLFFIPLAIIYLGGRLLMNE